MKTNIYFLSYLAYVFLEWEMFQTKVTEEVTTYILFSINCLRKSCHLWDNVEKYIIEPDRPQMTIWRMRIAFWIPKATNTLSEYAILIVFHCNSSCTNASRLYVIVHSLSCLLLFWKEYFLQKLVLAQSGMGWQELWSGRRRLDS
jgi:hypothetical protein